MILNGHDGEKFSLRIINYQFPDETNEYYDSNWLLIETSARDEFGQSWTTVDPCMLTVEVGGLINWLGSITNGELSEDEVTFLEPNLSFRCMDYNQEHVLIRVYFKLESRPDWATKISINQISIDLILSSKEIMAWINNLIIQLKKFPVRDV